MFNHCSDVPDEPDFFWDHEEDWKNTLKETEKISSQQAAAEKRAESERDETLNAEHLKRERNEKLDTADLERKIKDLEHTLEKLKDPRAIKRAKTRLAALRAIEEAVEQKRPPRYER